MRETKTQIMANAHPGASDDRIIANNTVEYHLPNGEKRIRLHHTDIIRYMPNGDVIVSTGGWQTVTTKERLNRFLNAGFWQEKGIWYVNYGGKTYAYQDGIVLKPDGSVENAGVDPKETRALRRKAKKFAKDYVKALRKGEVPKPSLGDCLYCLADHSVDYHGNFGGDLHIKSHIEEQYFVPSLLTNAMERFGASPMAKHEVACIWENKPEHSVMNDEFIWAQIEKLIRRWCFHELGLAV